MQSRHTPSTSTLYIGTLYIGDKLSMSVFKLFCAAVVSSCAKQAGFLVVFDPLLLPYQQADHFVRSSSFWLLHSFLCRACKPLPFFLCLLCAVEHVFPSLDAGRTISIFVCPARQHDLCERVMCMYSILFTTPQLCVLLCKPQRLAHIPANSTTP